MSDANQYEMKKEILSVKKDFLTLKRLGKKNLSFIEDINANIGDKIDEIKENCGMTETLSWISRITNYIQIQRMYKKIEISEIKLIHEITTKSYDIPKNFNYNVYFSNRK